MYTLYYMEVFKKNRTRNLQANMQRALCILSQCTIRYIQKLLLGFGGLFIGWILGSISKELVTVLSSSFLSLFITYNLKFSL